LSFMLLRLKQIRERARAEAAFPILEACAKALYPLPDTTENGTIDMPGSALFQFPSASNVSTWKSWILSESTRRTFIACFFFLSGYHILKEDLLYCQKHPDLVIQYTASAYLWNATTSLDFTTAWREKNHFVIRGFDMSELIATARADELDPFTRMFVVAYLGLEDAHAWFHDRGGAL